MKQSPPASIGSKSEHIREAELLIAKCKLLWQSKVIDYEYATQLLLAAQVHATLANAMRP